MNMYYQSKFCSILRMRKIGAIILISMLVFFTTPYSYEQFGCLSVWTDKTRYNTGETIYINGEVCEITQTPVTLFVIDPGGNLVHVGQVMPDYSGAYSHSVVAGGTMKISGNYSIIVSYNQERRDIAFKLTAVSPPLSSSSTTQPTKTQIPLTQTLQISESSWFPIMIIVIVGAAAGIGIAVSKRKKGISSAKATVCKKCGALITKGNKFCGKCGTSSVIIKTDDTQFWVCPNCGNNTEMKDGRQYCFSCKIYLSI